MPLNIKKHKLLDHQKSSKALNKFVFIIKNSKKVLQNFKENINFFPFFFSLKKKNSYINNHKDS